MEVLNRLLIIIDNHRMLLKSFIFLNMNMLSLLAIMLNTHMYRTYNALYIQLYIVYIVYIVHTETQPVHVPTGNLGLVGLVCTVCVWMDIHM